MLFLDYSVPGRSRKHEQYDTRHVPALRPCLSHFSTLRSNLQNLTPTECTSTNKSQPAYVIRIVAPVEPMNIPDFEGHKTETGRLVLPQ